MVIDNLDFTIKFQKQSDFTAKYFVFQKFGFDLQIKIPPRRRSEFPDTRLNFDLQV